MPDHRPAVRHTRQLARLEVALVRDLRQLATSLQRRLLDILQSRGLRGMALALPAELEVTRRAVTRRLTTAGVTVGAESEIFARADLTRLAGYLDAALNPDRAIAATLEVRARLQISEQQAAGRWLESFGGLLLAEATRLEVVGTPVPVAVPQLLAETLPADGRASLFRNALASLGVAATQFVFGLDSAGRAAIARSAQPDGVVFHKQVVAAIDARTTDCCRRAHGQIQPLDQPFVLIGTPRYADRIMHPPFHWHCRTVDVLYHERMERVGPTTAELREQVRP